MGGAGQETRRVADKGECARSHLEVLALAPHYKSQCARTGVYHRGLQAFIPSESRISPDTPAVLEMLGRLRASEMRR